MTIQEIKNAVDEGKVVLYNNPAYQVIKDNNGEYLIECTLNGNCIGLTNKKGDTLNGDKTRFFIG